MEVYVNNQGELACSEPQAHSTVLDLISAVEDFCRKHVDCQSCTNTCCAGYIVYADHIFLRRLTALAGLSASAEDADQLAMRSVRWDAQAGKWFLPPGPDGRCRFLSGQGRCLIYRARPLVCRLHVCYPAEGGYKQLKDSIYYAYHQAGRSEMSCMMFRDNPRSWDRVAEENPVFDLNDYAAVIQQVAAWAKKF